MFAYLKHIMKLILGRIWAIYGIIVFAGSMLLLMPLVLLTKLYSEPKKSIVFYPISKLWMRIFLWGTGCPLKIVGKAHFAKGTQYIVTSNHNSLLDVPITSPFIPGTNKTIGKIELNRIPIFKYMYERGSVLVDRRSDASRKKSYELMKQVLANKMHMCIYPEGTRNQSNEVLQPFKEGAFRLAVDTQTAIIPCLLFNTSKALPTKPNFCYYPTALQMHFLPPIHPAGHTVASLNELVYNTMRTYYVAHNGLV